MKGFISLVEVAFGAVLLVITLGSFFAIQSVKLSWSRSDLIATGNNILYELKNSGNITKLLNYDESVLSEIETIKPKNIKYALEISNTPKTYITVGSAQGYDFDRAKKLLTGVYVNKRWINFTVEEFDIKSGEIPDEYDAFILINYDNYTKNEDKIQNFLNKGKTILGINDTKNNADSVFNRIYNLTPAPSGSEKLNFTKYSPLENKIAKYFLGFGFDVSTTNFDNIWYGYWYIWEEPRRVNNTGSVIDIENKTIDEGLIQNKKEGDTFNLKDPNGNFYTFKIKKIFGNQKVIIQALTINFTFKDFSDTNDVIGNNTISNGANTFAAMTKNNTAIWISDFPDSDEYKTLVQAAIATSVLDWYVVEPYRLIKHAYVSSFIPLCCDMPEVAEFTFILWYAY